MKKFIFYLQRFSLENTTSGVAWNTPDSETGVITNTAENVTILGTAGNDTISNGGGGKNSIIYDVEGNNTLQNDAKDATIIAGDGRDRIDDRATNALIIAGNGKNTINANENCTIFGGSDNDFIGNGKLVVAGDGKNNIRSWEDDGTIIGGNGNDTIQTSGNNVLILAGDGKNDIQLIHSELDDNGENCTVFSGSGDDRINGGKIVVVEGGNNYVFADAGALIVTGDGDDNIWGNEDGGSTIVSHGGNNAVNACGDLVITGSGKDSVRCRTGNNTVISGGGDDYISTYTGSNNLIFASAGNDDIYLQEGNSTVQGGTGDDSITVCDTASAVVQYALGDGNDTINAYDEKEFTLQLATSNYSTIADDNIYSNTIFVKVGNDTITVLGNNFTIEEIDSSELLSNILSDISVSTPTKPTNIPTAPTFDAAQFNSLVPISPGETVDNSTSTNNNSTSTNNSSTESSGGSSSGGSGTVINIANNITNNNITNNNITNIINNTDIDVNNTTVNVSVDASQTIVNTTLNLTNNIYVYEGGSRTIANYAGQKINYSSDFTGLGFTDTDFMLNSTSGALTIQNARDKVIDVAVNDNTVAYAYYASGGGELNGSSFAQLEVILGGNNSDNNIFAGSGGSSLWGGVGGSDILNGGAGEDEIFFGKSDGADVINNAGSADIINLYDVTLADILSADISGNAITANLTSGASLQINSAENLSATFRLADGSYKYNHSSGEWQSA